MVLIILNAIFGIKMKKGISCPEGENRENAKNGRQHINTPRGNLFTYYIIDNILSDPL